MGIYGAYYFGQFQNLKDVFKLQKQIKELVPRCIHAFADDIVLVGELREEQMGRLRCGDML